MKATVATIGPTGYIRYREVAVDKAVIEKKKKSLKPKRRVVLLNKNSVLQMKNRASKRLSRQKPWRNSMGSSTRNIVSPPPPFRFMVEEKKVAFKVDENENEKKRNISTKSREDLLLEKSRFQLILQKEADAGENAAAIAALEVQNNSPELSPDLPSLYKRTENQQRKIVESEKRKRVRAARASNQVILSLRLRRAVLDGKSGLSALRALLPCGDAVNIAAVGSNIRPNDGKTALHIACEKSNPKAVALLLESGANLNVVDNKGQTPISLCSSRAVRTEIDRHINRQRQINEHLTRPFLEASSLGQSEKVKEYLQRGADIKARVKNIPIEKDTSESSQNKIQIQSEEVSTDWRSRNFGKSRTALHLAVLGGHTSTVKILLQAGADVTAVDDDGKTPVQLCSFQKIEDELFAVNRGKKKDEIAAEKLRNAAQNGSIEEATRLIGSNPNAVSLADANGLTPLHCACGNGQVGITALLLQSGANPSSVDSMLRWTPLHIASFGGHAAVIKLLCEHSQPSTKKLGKKRRINIEATDLHFRTPLHLASEAGRVAAVAELLRHGASVTARNDRGHTCIEAERYTRDHIEIRTANGVEKRNASKKGDNLVHLVLDGALEREKKKRKKVQHRSRSSRVKQRDIPKNEKKVLQENKKETKAKKGRSIDFVVSVTSPVAPRKPLENPWALGPKKKVRSKLRHRRKKASKAVREKKDSADASFFYTDIKIKEEESDSAKEEKIKIKKVEQKLKRKPTQRQLAIRKLKAESRKKRAEKEKKSKEGGIVTSYGESATNRLKRSMAELDAIKSLRENAPQRAAMEASSVALAAAKAANISASKCHIYVRRETNDVLTKMKAKEQSSKIVSRETTVLHDAKDATDPQILLGLGLTEASMNEALNPSLKVEPKPLRRRKLPGSLSLKERIGKLKKRAARKTVHHWSERNTFDTKEKRAIEEKRNIKRMQARMKKMMSQMKLISEEQQRKKFERWKLKKKKKVDKDNSDDDEDMEIDEDALEEFEKLLTAEGRGKAVIEGYKKMKRRIRLAATFPYSKDALVGLGRFNVDAAEVSGVAARAAISAAITASSEAAAAFAAMEIAVAATERISPMIDTSHPGWTLDGSSRNSSQRKYKNLVKQKIYKKKPKHAAKQVVQQSSQKIVYSPTNAKKEIKTERKTKVDVTDDELKRNELKMQLIELQSKAKAARLKTKAAIVQKMKVNKRKKGNMKGYSPAFRLRAFYSQHQPSKLPHVHKILRVYRGKEEELFAKLEKKYESKLKDEEEEEDGDEWQPWEQRQKKGQVSTEYFAKIEEVLSLPF
eukprot:g4988.t1